LTPRIRFRDESGAALVEFALVIPWLLVVLLAIMDVGRAFNYWIDSTHLANVTARYAAVNNNPGAADGLTLQQYIEGQADTKELREGSSQVPDPVNVCISFPAGTSVGDPVNVEVKSKWAWFGYLTERFDDVGLPLETEISGSATMRLEAAPTNYSEGCT
jgi:Flp pilus assembly protein TadG